MTPLKFEPIQDILDWVPPKFYTLVGSPSQNLITQGSRTVCYGQWGTWKSMLMMDLGFKLAKGEPWLGFPVKRSRVALLNIEIPKYMMRLRLETYINGNGNIVPDNFFIANEPFYKMDTGPQYELGTQFTLLKPDVFIIDPLYRIVSRDMNSNYEISRLLDFIDEKLIGYYNAAIILIGHIRKPPTFDPSIQDNESMDLAHELIGASFIADWADTTISIRKPSAQADDLNMVFEKTRHALEEIHPKHVNVTRSTLQFEVSP